MNPFMQQSANPPPLPMQSMLGGGMDGPALNELIALSLAGQDQSQGSMIPPEGLSPPEIDPGILLQMLMGAGEEMGEPPPLALPMGPPPNPMIGPRPGMMPPPPVGAY